MAEISFKDYEWYKNLRRGTDEHRKFFRGKEERRMKYLCKEFVNEYGGEAEDVMYKARLRVTVETEPRGLMTFAEEVVGKYGPEAYGVMKKAMRRMWCDFAKKLMKKLNIEERDAIGAIKLYTFVHRELGEIVEAKPQRAVREERICPFTKIWDAEWCYLASGAAMEGICDAVNPKLVCRQEKLLTKGDDCCRMVFEMKE